MAYFTKYFCSYRLDKKHVLILNTLTNAIDVVDYETCFCRSFIAIAKDDINISAKFVYQT